jgi:hypothetical protein
VTSLGDLRHGRALATVSAIVAALAFSIAGDARAQDVTNLSAPTTNAPVPPRVGLNELPYWAQGRIRPFFAAVFDVGGIFARTEMNVGYGRPHYAWGGLEVAAKLALGGVTIYAGPRLTLANLDLRAGVRAFSATGQNLVVPEESVDRNDLERESPPRSHYQAVDAELNLNVPAPGGAVGFLFGISGIVGVPEGFFVFDDILRVVVDPPIVWHSRLAYVANVGRDHMLAVGGTLEIIGNPERDLVVLRTGPIVTLSLTDHLQATGAAAFVVASRDDLGIAGDDIGQIALRYRWASGEPWPQFP